MFEIKTNPIITIDGYDVKILKDICRFANLWIGERDQQLPTQVDVYGDVSPKTTLVNRLSLESGDLALIRQMLTRVRLT